MEVSRGTETCLVPVSGSENRVEKAEVHTSHRTDPNCSRGAARKGLGCCIYGWILQKGTGVEQAGFGGFYGEGDERNFACPPDPEEIQTNGRAQVRAVLFAMRQCTRANPMARVKDSEFCCNGLTKHILLWERRDRLGIFHSDQWVQILGLARGDWPGIRLGKINFSGCHHTSP